MTMSGASRCVLSGRAAEVAAESGVRKLPSRFRSPVMLPWPMRAGDEDVSKVEDARKIPRKELLLRSSGGRIVIVNLSDCWCRSSIGRIRFARAKPFARVGYGSVMACCSAEYCGWREVESAAWMEEGVSLAELKFRDVRLPLACWSSWRGPSRHGAAGLEQRPAMVGLRLRSCGVAALCRAWLRRWADASRATAETRAERPGAGVVIILRPTRKSCRSSRRTDIAWTLLWFWLQGRPARPL
jgi:hypothetical protein